MDFKQKLSQIIRVNHAGEFGARVIYDGQMAAFSFKKDKESLALVKHMKEQEDRHFEYFDDEIRVKNIRPTIMQPLWKMAGFSMGFLTAFCGKRSAMACTVAVEEVIDEHYQGQIFELESLKSESNLQEKVEIEGLQQKIGKFRQEELEHRDTAYSHNAQDAKFYQPLTFAIRMASKLAIFTSTKI